jgi:hypothetical protein
MGANQMRLYAIFSVIMGIILAAGCSSSGQTGGTLTGHVDIGPLQPVVRVGEPEPTPSPAMYAAWQIVVLSGDGHQVIARVGISSRGVYQVLIPAGIYKVTAEPVNGAGFGAQQVHSVEIIRGETTQLVVSIDTGIR